MSGGDTIYALSSAPGPAGVAVIRLSGPSSDAICEALTGALPAPRAASLRTLRDPETREPVDRGLVLRFPGPNSFTGEDCVEFQVHGGRAVLDDLFAVLNRFPDARLAEPGEFSRRAFVNGRMDLTAAEGVADLVAAETSAQRRAALAQADGALARLYDGWRARLIHHLAHIEAWLDFPDEDLPDDVFAALIEGVRELTADIAAHLQDARRGERLRDGLTVAIVGPPNAGKSTLMNALAERDVAIVSDVPGTTRDVLEVHLDLGGYPVVLIDTAGLRESDDTVEREGVRRALDRARSADLVLALTPVTAPDGPQPYRPPQTGDGPDVGPEVISVGSKADAPVSDLPSRNETEFDVILSAQTGVGLSGLIEGLTARAAALTDAGGRVLPTRLRHRQGLSDCLTHLERAGSFDPALPRELLAEDLRLAMRALGRITGTVDVEDLLDVIFRDFCIGK
ncbi:tRNA uridine-5-carboxymethylaminomethyl(34) synthesis GTPase MnmE [Minwuia sp.]|uniref:tRNA uridine-5-carboxymethylaminomethyl(34) synthesis GTPase MnmE n=1 Tax=Minwuia sp. TaxID=2493630 RepID=UPI003A94F105